MKTKARLGPAHGKTPVDRSGREFLVDHVFAGNGQQFRVALQGKDAGTH